MHYEVLDEKGRKIFFQLQYLKDFYLAGGTALALQIGHRISVDFDLFTSRQISKEHFRKIKLLFSTQKIYISVNNSEELTFFLNEKKITLLHYPFPVINKFVKYQGVHFLSIREIGATKAYTIGRRGSWKDYADMYFILSGRYATLSQIIDLASKKFKKEFNGRLFLEQLLYLEDVKDEPIIFLKKKITKKQLINFFENEIKKLRL